MEVPSWWMQENQSKFRSVYPYETEMRRGHRVSEGSGYLIGGCSGFYKFGFGSDVVRVLGFRECQDFGEPGTFDRSLLCRLKSKFGTGPPVARLFSSGMQTPLACFACAIGLHPARVLRR